MSISISLAGLSDIGRARSRNEDCVVVVGERSLAVVADGMGGHPGGDVASRIAASTMADELADSLSAVTPDHGPDTLAETMARSVASAHAAIRAAGSEEPELDGMGTTLTGLAILPESGRWLVGHVGDSRVYLLRGGRLDQLTRDDTWVQERVEAGQLTQEQAGRHPLGHLLTQCVGLEDAPEPHFLEGEVRAGDVFLLCTDGLVGMLEDGDLHGILTEEMADERTEETARATARALVEEANEAGGYDNITVALAVVS